MNRLALNRRLHAAGRDAGLGHEDLREIAPRVIGDERWHFAGSLANLLDSELSEMVWAVEGWRIVEDQRQKRGLL